MTSASSTTYLVHGFNVKDGGADTVEKLRPYLEATSKGTIWSWPYGWFGLLSVLFKNKHVARELKDNEDHLPFNSFTYGVGHSNGCAILVEAAKQGATFHHLLLINPALKVDTRFPASIRKITIVHTANDKPTKAARFFDKIPLIQLLVPNAWGAMGAFGAVGDDPRVFNLDMSEDLFGHSDLFEDRNLKQFGHKLATILHT